MATSSQLRPPMAKCGSRGWTLMRASSARIPGSRASAAAAQNARSTSIAGIRSWERSAKVSVIAATARSQSPSISLTPLSIRLSPSPSNYRPWTIDRLVRRAIHVTAPVTPMRSQKAPVKRPDARIAPAR